jgi:hypothetical protein
VIAFQQHYNGRFVNMLRWHQLDELWNRVKQTQPDGWYVYLIGEIVPTTPVDVTELNRFIQEVDTFLRQKHDHDYCGIVYVDDRRAPSMIKIFDPTNLGAVCGSSGSKILPRWLLTRIPPEAIVDNTSARTKPKHWWQSFTF